MEGGGQNLFRPLWRQDVLTQQSNREIQVLLFHAIFRMGALVLS